MAIFRISASADNTITNAFEENLSTRGTGSNMGASSILEVFSIYGQASTDSLELARTLIQFPIQEFINKRNVEKVLPASGSVEYYLKLYNAPHTDNTPKSYDLFILPISKTWQEGIGLDMVNYKDLTYEYEGSNWINNASASTWTTEGGDFLYEQALTASLTTGLEDIEIDVSNIVEKWIKGTDGGAYNNYGFGIILSSSLELEKKSYYTKKFFSRETEFYYKRPILEARWNDVKKDDRGKFYLSSSVAPAEDNLNTVYLYNYVRGKLKNIPTIGEYPIYLSIYSGSLDNSEPTGSPLDMVIDGNNVSTGLPKVVTGSYVSTGVYKATFAFTGSSAMTKIFDVWFSGSNSLSSAEGAIQFHTGSITLSSIETSVGSDDSKYVLSILNNKNLYRNNEKARFRLYTRYKNWSPNIYTTAISKPENITINDAIYRIYRVSDGSEVINYDSGSLKHNQLSYDVSGNYIDIDMSALEPNFQYALKFSFYDDYVSCYEEQPYIFKFRVIE